jgi:serine/threonine-protein kinase RsbW
MDTAVFPGQYESLARISEFVMKEARHAGFDEDACYAIQTAVDEACSNIIEHAYGGEGMGNIVVSVNPQKDRLTIVLNDTGRSFDPKSVRDPDIHSKLYKRKEGGLGLFFIRKFMDEVRFDFSTEQGNQLTMVKYKEKPS